MTFSSPVPAASNRLLLTHAAHLLTRATTDLLVALDLDLPRVTVLGVLDNGQSMDTSRIVRATQLSAIAAERAIGALVRNGYVGHQGDSFSITSSGRSALEHARRLERDHICEHVSNMDALRAGLQQVIEQYS